MAAAAVAAVALALGGSSEPVEPPEANLAACGEGADVAAPGPGWRRAGPLAVPPRPLRSMRRASSGDLEARMDVVLSGHRFVVLSVPLDLRNRVFLYYGQVLDNRGGQPRSLFGAPGYAETEFQPCRDRRRTAWSGGIRVIGSGPVRLLVTVEGRTRSLPLRLGRPAVAGPAT